MIFSIIITVAATIFGALGLLMPPADIFGTQVTDAFVELGTYFSYFDFLINISALLSAVSLIVAFELILASINLFRWIIRSVPFLNTRI